MATRDDGKIDGKLDDKKLKNREGSPKRGSSSSSPGKDSKVRRRSRSRSRSRSPPPSSAGAVRFREAAADAASAASSAPVVTAKQKDAVASGNLILFKKPVLLPDWKLDTVIAAVRTHPETPEKTEGWRAGVDASKSGTSKSAWLVGLVRETEHSDLGLCYFGLRGIVFQQTIDAKEPPLRYLSASSRSLEDAIVKHDCEAVASMMSLMVNDSKDDKKAVLDKYLEQAYEPADQRIRGLQRALDAERKALDKKRDTMILHAGGSVSGKCQLCPPQAAEFLWPPGGTERTLTLSPFNQRVCFEHNVHDPFNVKVVPALADLARKVDDKGASKSKPKNFYDHERKREAARWDVFPERVGPWGMEWVIVTLRGRQTYEVVMAVPCATATLKRVVEAALDIRTDIFGKYREKRPAKSSRVHLEVLSVDKQVRHTDAWAFEQLPHNTFMRDLWAEAPSLARDFTRISIHVELPI